MCRILSVCERRTDYPLPLCALGGCCRTLGWVEERRLPRMSDFSAPPPATPGRTSRDIPERVAGVTQIPNNHRGGVCNAGSKPRNCALRSKAECLIFDGASTLSILLAEKRKRASKSRRLSPVAISRGESTESANRTLPPLLPRVTYG